MKFKRIDRGVIADGKLYRTTFQSQGEELVDIDIDVAVEIVDRYPDVRQREERRAMQEMGITEQDIVG